MTDRRRRNAPDTTPLGRQIGRKAERRIRGRREPRRTVWFGLGMFGLIGWSVAIPMLLGIAAGLWLDRRFAHESVSWTLSFLIIGTLVGCLNAWFWVRQESRDDD